MNAPTLGPAVRTTCPYCGVGCGVIARADGFGGARVEGDPEHPANKGRLCSKGSALGETLSLDGRLLHPMRRDMGGGYTQISWDEALGRVAEGFRATIARHGPDAVAFYVSGQLLTEDYYVANKLMKGFIGSGNIDTNSRLCMASSVAGHRRAFGSDTVPGCYEDLDEADLLVLVGSNAAWCHPVLFQRMVKNRRERGARIVLIDPRRTATAEDADLVLPVAPGTDSVLFAGLLASLSASNRIDRRFVADHTVGFAEALARSRHIAPDADAVARRCELPLADVERFFAWFATTERVVSLYSQGVNQSAQGTDKVNAILNCHLATGRIGKPGAGPFSLTGQPNAMGGREVGGLANQLAAHMGFEPESVDRVRRFWNAPQLADAPGLKSVELFDAVASGRIKALWVMATNPAVSLPRADAVRQALSSLDLLVVSEVMASTDTIASGADILLPGAAWGEKDGTVTNSERRISRQRAFLTPPGEVRPDWWIVTEVARRMGFGAAFGYGTPAEVFREHAALSAFENDGSRDFDIGALAGASDDEYAGLLPVQWPLPAGCAQGAARLFAHGGFYTPDRRAEFVAVDNPELSAKPSSAYPLRLNTGRVRDHWHTMSRTGKAPRLCQHIEAPFVSINPDDAARLSVEDGGFARVTTLHGSAVLSVAVSDGQRPGEIFAPIHWNGETASHARVGALVHSAVDPHSGQPELKATPAAIVPIGYRARGFLLSRRALALPSSIWWSRVALGEGWGFRIAFDAEETEWPAIARRLLGETELAEFEDGATGRYRAAVVAQDRLQSCLFIARDERSLPRWDWLKAQMATLRLGDEARRALLAGRAPGVSSDDGPNVCACFGVGRRRILEAYARGGATCAEDIGRLTKAGTNCGSCLPEIRRLAAGAVKERLDEPAA